MKELLYLKDDQLKDLIEKLFVSYRETFSDSKKILDRYSIGLAHHKVIHLLSMYEGISISELLKRLKVTKQSLNRVLKDLIKLEIVIFKKDDQDTRVKHVFLNDKGKKIFNEIFNLQKKRIYNALLSSKSEEVIKTNSCNTLLFKEEIHGFNTDYFGFLHSINQKQLDRLNKILVIGIGLIGGSFIKAAKKYNISKLQKRYLKALQDIISEKACKIFYQKRYMKGIANLT